MTSIANIRNISAPSISANALILDLLAAHEAHELTVGALCRAASVFGMTEQSVRVALTRLVRQKKVSSPARGIYAWNPAGSSLFDDVRNWLRKDRRTVSWNGNWVGIVEAGVPRGNRVNWRRHERAADLRGFRAFRNGLRLRPDNLGGGVEGLRRELHMLGLASSATVLGVNGLSEDDDSRARDLWDVNRLQSGYRDMVERLKNSEAALERLTPEAAAAETLLLGRAVIREIVHDPLLPDDLSPSAERRTLIDRMQRYQARARAIWMGVLRQA